MRLQVPERFQGPPKIGHGGYVAGLLAGRSCGGAVQVTLRRPTPLDTDLELRDLGEGRFALIHGDTVTAEAVPGTLSLDIPKPPSLEQARAAVAGSPAQIRGGRGVHPTCFGCGALREPGDGLRLFAGPTEVDGQAMVATTWQPQATFSNSDGRVDPLWVTAALDCAGAFAFIADNQSAGLLGRIIVEQFAPVRGDRESILIGWQVGSEGRKLFAGTALCDADGTPLAAAHATWFGFPKA